MKTKRKKQEKNKMVITPRQTTEAMSLEERAQLRMLEKQVDQNLMEGKTAMPLTEGIAPHLRHCLVNLYQRAGWEVQYAPNQDGAYLLFHEHKEVRGFRKD